MSTEVPRRGLTWYVYLLVVLHDLLQYAQLAGDFIKCISGRAITESTRLDASYLFCDVWESMLLGQRDPCAEVQKVGGNVVCLEGLLDGVKNGEGSNFKRVHGLLSGIGKSRY